jgi:hypothetical protein
MVRVLVVSIIATIVVSFTALCDAPAQPMDYNRGYGTESWEMYRQRQVEQQLELQRQRLELQQQQLEMQRQKLEIEQQRQRIELEKQRIELQKPVDNGR